MVAGFEKWNSPLREDVDGEIPDLVDRLTYAQLTTTAESTHLEIILHLLRSLGQRIAKLDLGGVVIDHPQRPEFLDLLERPPETLDAADVRGKGEDFDRSAGFLRRRFDFFLLGCQTRGVTGTDCYAREVFLSECLGDGDADSGSIMLCLLVSIKAVVRLVFLRTRFRRARMLEMSL